MYIDTCATVFAVLYLLGCLHASNLADRLMQEVNTSLKEDSGYVYEGSYYFALTALWPVTTIYFHIVGILNGSTNEPDDEAYT